MLILLIMAGAILIMFGFRDQGEQLVRFSVVAGLVVSLAQPACSAAYALVSESIQAVSTWTLLVLGAGYLSCALFFGMRLLASKHAEKERAEAERARTRERPRLPAPAPDDGESS